MELNLKTPDFDVPPSNTTLNNQKHIQKLEFTQKVIPVS